MTTRKLNITHLLDNGGRIVPRKLIFNYRYTRSDIVSATQARVSVYITLDSANPDTLVYSGLLFIPTIIIGGMTAFTTDIFEMPITSIATGMWLEIVNSEWIEIKNIDLVFNAPSILPTGHTVNSTNELSVVSLVVNDGSIYSENQEVALNSVCTGTPTYAMMSRYSTFSDTSWEQYGAGLLFDLYQKGVNRIYFKVKDVAEVETVSQYVEVAWDGA